MAERPQNIEELEQWIDAHQDDGKIDGQPVIQAGTIEFRSGFVPGNLYDEALLVGAAFSFSKSNIGTHSLLKFLASPLTEMLQSQLLELGQYEPKTEFRAYIPTSLYNLAIATRDKLGWNNSHLMTVSLCLFVSDPGVKQAYQGFLTQVSEQSGLSATEVEQKIFDRRRYEARVKRLELSRQRGEFVGDRKIAT